MKQIIPCNVKMYAVYRGDGEEEIKSPIIAFGIDGEGFFRAIAFDEELGGDYADEPCSFLRYELEECDRIADSLEGINESLGALAECVDEVPLTSYAPGYTFFHIGGGVETGY